MLASDDNVTRLQCLLVPATFSRKRPGDSSLPRVLLDSVVNGLFLDLEHESGGVLEQSATAVDGWLFTGLGNLHGITRSRSDGIVLVVE